MLQKFLEVLWSLWQSCQCTLTLADWLMLFQVLNSILLTVSVMGNFGTFTKRWHDVLIDFDFVYHAGYVSVSILGLCVHEFFYSLLVSRVLAVFSYCRFSVHTEAYLVRFVPAAFWHAVLGKFV